MAKSEAPCFFHLENSFGPVVAGECLGGFDFTLLFEEGILILLPLAGAASWGTYRLARLRREATKLRSSRALTSKIVLFAGYWILQISILAAWVSTKAPRTRLTTATLALTIVGYSLLSVVSYLEHVRSFRPSTSLCVYLGLSILLDLPRIRTLFALLPEHAVPRLLLASLCIKVLLFLCELTEKRRLLLQQWRGLPSETTSGVMNRSLFIWLNENLIAGFRTLLTVNLLTPIDEEILAASEPTALKKRWQRADKTKKHALLRTFLWHYKWAFLAGVIPRLAQTGFLFSQPFLIPRVLDFVKEPEGPNSKATAYGLIGAYAIVYIGVAVSFAVYQHKVYRLLTLFRGSLVALIFDKTLHIESSLLSEAEAVTLMSADIDRIGVSLPVIHEIYASLIETALCLFLLYRLLKVALAGSILWTVVCLILGLPVATLSGNAQGPWLEAIRERLTATAKSLSSMKAVKLTGLTNIVSSTVAELRRLEILVARRYRILNICLFVIYFASSSLTPVWGFGVYVILAKARNTGTLTEGLVFSALSLFRLLDQPLVHALYGFQHIRTMITSFNRIQTYLVAQERESLSAAETKRLRSDTGLSNDQASDEVTLNDFSDSDWTDRRYVATMKDAAIGYTSQGGLVLRKLNLTIARGQTTVIFGPVGSGKTSLLKLLLGEVPIELGVVNRDFSNAAFCPQTPWLIRGTIRTNVVGIAEWDKEWYDTVLQACALSAEVELLEIQDGPPRGPGGSRLSGGQQMRVSLARAIYSRQPIMIFDDVFTGLDRATERHVLDAVFGPSGLLKKLNTTAILATTSANHLSFAENIITIDEKGFVEQREATEEIAIDPEKPAVTAEKSYGQCKEPVDPIVNLQQSFKEDFVTQLDVLEDPKPDTSRRAGDFTIYTYFAKIAGWPFVCIYLTACAIYIFGLTFPSVWLQWWVKANETHPNERIGYWLGVYGGLAGLAIVGSGIAESVYNLGIIPKASKRFHELLLTTTMRAPAAFFAATDPGSILTRFSQDLQLIDNDLPLALGRATFQFLFTIASSVLVFMASGYVAAAIPLCIAVLLMIQFYYLRTSRQLRLLDIEAKAPLFALFLETISGITSIRAYGWSRGFEQRNLNALNVSQKPYYLLWCCQRWLTLVLDLFNAGIAILIVSVAVTTRNGSTQYLGVALFNIVTFGATLQALINQWTLVETALGAISRIRSYVAEVKDENLPAEDGPIPQDWPEQGHVEFQNVSASYDQCPKPVLHKLNFAVKSGEKVAICGRTGSGKSSLIATLLRNIELDAGAVLVDDIDLTTLSRDEIRTRINTLPQTPLLLHGSVRKNIDPHGVSSDEHIIDVLHSVSMWEFLESRGGLSGDMRQDELSTGQKQLICLARAVIHQGSILIMDEATSSVDADTDALMQRVIRKNFKNATVIAVVHKLQTILDYDQVIVLDHGQIVERGKPSELLDQTSSRFRILYDSMGSVDVESDESETP
ncbi:Canalicular multispecific organic anion transporter 2 [Paramyrothecium foliicola]|nr:Canalicular multispecific organic anion transporter 2 [Paramyrothecium foliicola]